MICQRCFGLCVPHYLMDQGTRVSAAKCVNCGDIVDPTIIENRTHIAKPKWRSVEVTDPKSPALFSSLV